MAASFHQLLLLLALGGCAGNPGYMPPQPPSSAAMRSGAFLRIGDAKPAAPLARWWEGLNDPLLSELIIKGVRKAPSIIAIQARVRQARSRVSGARARALPLGGTSATYAGADLPAGAIGEHQRRIDLGAVGFDARWELDLWGTRRREIEKTDAQLGAAAARLADAQVRLSAEIARNYVLLRTNERSLKLLEERHGYETRVVELTRQRLAAGTVAEQSADNSMMQVRRTEGELALIRAAITTTRDGLAVLTGEAPGALDNLPGAAIPLPPVHVLVDDPAAMLARRPDIRLAERQLAAATAQIGIDRGRSFPQVTLLGLIGLGRTSSDGLLDSSQLLTAVLPRLTWNFLDFGRNRAAVEEAEAGRDAALAEYDGVILAALQDAEASLAHYGAAKIAYAASNEEARFAKNTARLQYQRANAGTIAKGAALESQRQATNSQLNEAERRSSLALAFIAVAKAIGLGWTNFTN